MLFVHEVHQVVGRKEDEFEAAFRDGWMPMLAKDDDARLLWYMNHAHGSGVSYNVVTITAVRDGAAWERSGAAAPAGRPPGLGTRGRHLPARRHRRRRCSPCTGRRSRRSTSRRCPPTGREHELSLFMEDTGWPYVVARRLHQDVGRALLPADPSPAEGTGTVTIDIQACFQDAHGTGLRREAMLWQTDRRTRRRCCTCSRPTSRRRCASRGPTCTSRSTYRDQWESKLLRTSKWSPLY